MGGFSTLYGSKWVATARRTAFMAGVLVGFSTLYGSKWVATRQRLEQVFGVAGFQYPLRVEVGCNPRAKSVARSSVQVSVPSTGRSGLQHDPPPSHDSQPTVSVPSTGRSGLQPTTITRRGRDCSGFQYPLRVEVGCNVKHAQRSEHLSICFSTLYGSKWVAT